MNWDLSWAIVRKDFKEFRKNKFILYTLVTFPIVFTIIMPMSVIGPIMASGWQPVSASDVGQQIPIKTVHDLNQTDMDILAHGLTKNETLYLNNYHLRYVNASYIFINESWIENAKLDYVIIRHCNLNNVTIEHGLIYGSFIRDTTINDGKIYNSGGINVTITADVVTQNTKIADLHNPSALSLTELESLLTTMVMMMFVLIPSATPTVIASFSIIGEKKNKSLEPILATPISDFELLVGKIMASFIPTILTTWGAYVLFSVIMQFMSVPLFGTNIAFAPMLLVGVFILSPLVCLLSIVANVLISTKVNDVRAAQQLGSLVVLPLIFLFMVPLFGLASLGALAIIGMTLIVGSVDALLLWINLKVFNRENILVNWS